MYKVFIKNIPLNFVKSTKENSTLPSKYLPSLQQHHFKDLKIYLQKSNQDTPTTFFSEDPLSSIKTFFNKFNWIEAAGGVVINKKTKDFLFIYRKNIWDIPKGKIENGETPETAAIREIREECGIQDLKIIDKLSNTFHSYFAYKKYWIKKTHWFILETEQLLTTPQLEEGITKADWFPLSKLEFITANTYASLIDIIKNIKDRFDSF